MAAYNRRSFIKHAGLGAAGLAAASSTALHTAGSTGEAVRRFGGARRPPNAVSLATWSLNRSYQAGIWDLLDIARICREDFDIGGVEYVTYFFDDVRQIRLRELNQRADDYGVQNVLIMVDQEGHMASPDRDERIQAAINHRKWVDIANFLGCYAIRCNTTGGGASPEEDPDALERATESFSHLLEYAEPAGIQIIVENHGGGLASNARWLADLAESIDHPNFGLLPDYGNFGGEGGAEQIYESVRITMPYATGVSVKGRWSPEGEQVGFSLERCLNISLDSGFEGYWGIESSIRREEDPGDQSPLQIKNDEWNAVRWTKQVIDDVVLS